MDITTRDAECGVMGPDGLLVGRFEQAVDLTSTVVVQLNLTHAELVSLLLASIVSDLLDCRLRKLQVRVVIHESWHRELLSSADQPAGGSLTASQPSEAWPDIILEQPCLPAPSDILRIAGTATTVLWLAARAVGGVLTTPVTASGRDLRALAAIVSADRPDVPSDEGLPPSLLRDLMDQIRCDVVAFGGFDSERQQMWYTQTVRGRGADAVTDQSAVHWEHYWNCQLCSYPDRTGDLRSIVTIGDFYSTREWHAIGRCGIYQPMGFEHALMMTLPAHPGGAGRPGRTLRLFFFRGPGGFFRDRPCPAHAAATAPAPGLSRC